jgi:hypothetical protein
MYPVYSTSSFLPSFYPLPLFLFLNSHFYISVKSPLPRLRIALYGKNHIESDVITVQRIRSVYSNYKQLLLSKKNIQISCIETCSSREEHVGILSFLFFSRVEGKMHYACPVARVTRLCGARQMATPYPLKTHSRPKPS